MTLERKNRIKALLKGIETGDPESVLVINPDKYIQHNPQTYEGREGLAALFKRLSQTSPRVNIVRIFSDGDFVFGHTEYEFGSSRVGFEVFRFEGDQAVEHWDNIQPRKGPNLARHSMVDGAVEVLDLSKTEENRVLAKNFVETVLIGCQIQELPRFVADDYTEHNPELGDGLPALQGALSEQNADGVRNLIYQKQHRLLAEGNFVLSVCEGFRNGLHVSFYDLFRFENGKIVEHWDTTEKVPPPEEWKNENGKF